MHIGVCYITVKIRNGGVGAQNLALSVRGIHIGTHCKLGLGAVS